MKVGFWAVGIPNWSYSEIAERASELGYEGIVLPVERLGEHRDKPDKETLRDIRRPFDELGIDISCLLSRNSKGAYPGCANDEIDWDQVETELAADAFIAQQLGCSSILITVQRPVKDVRWDWDVYLDDLARSSLRALGNTPGLKAIYENHVSSASAQQLFEMVERVGDERLGVMFSPDHCVVMQENTVELVERYSAAIEQVCLGDRKPVEEDLGKFDGRYYYVRYESCVVGEGLVPTAKILNVLDQQGFSGYVALKWEKQTSWAGAHLPNGFGHHLPDGEVVLPQFIEYLESIGFGPKARA